MPTPLQLRTIHKGARVVGLIDRDGDHRYRLMLRNVGGVNSAKELDNDGVEDVMATLEDMGFDGHPRGKTYWRDTVARRGTNAGRRALHRIEQLAKSQRYCLPTLCERFSGNRTQVPEQLTPKEAWNLIEMLKSVAAREHAQEASPVTANQEEELPF